MKLIHSILFVAALAQASQIILSSKPSTAYTLPTERTFLLNVPEAYDHEKQHSLVLSFHGGKSSSGLRENHAFVFLSL
jgi:poly(3-hydroxybutyrate) depolymerase